MFPLVFYAKSHHHPLDVRLIDDIDERFDDAEERSKIHAARRKHFLGRAVHPKHLIGLGPSGGAMGYGGHGAYGGHGKIGS